MKPPLPRIESAVPRALHVQLEIAKAMRTLTGPDERELARQRRAEIAAIGRDIELLAVDIRKAFESAATLAKAELRAALKKYNADQPRVPAGNPDGGQWTNTGGDVSSATIDGQRAGGVPQPRQYAQLATDTQVDAAATGDNPYRQGSDSGRVQLVNDIPPAVGLAAALQRLVAAGRITEEEAAAVQQSANAYRAAESARLAAAIEGITVNEAQSVLSSQEFAQLRAAYLAEQESTVTIGGRTIQYEPNIPPYISAMTNFEKNGFSIGPGAFATPQETQATVLQELYRLNTTVAGATGVHSGESAALELDAARKFVDKVLRSGVMDQ
jgi:hypothetical protein